MTKTTHASATLRISYGSKLRYRASNLSGGYHGFRFEERHPICNRPLFGVLWSLALALPSDQLLLRLLVRVVPVEGVETRRRRVKRQQISHVAVDIEHR